MSSTPSSPAATEYSPIVSRTYQGAERGVVSRHDCTRLAFVRAGSAWISGDFGLRRTQRGDLLIVRPTAPAQMEPTQDGVVVTTLFVDPDFLLDGLLWEFAAHLRGRVAAESFLQRRSPRAVRWVELEEEALCVIEPWLDELVALSARPAPERRFKRSVALFFAVADAIEPAFDDPDAALPPPAYGVEGDLSLPRLRPFEPVRPELVHAIDLLAADVPRAWTLPELAAAVGLSPNHLRQLFVRSFGKTPWAYLNLLRARLAAELLLDRERRVPDVMREVGWQSTSHGAKMFRRFAGCSPRQYRATADRQRPAR